MRLIDALNQLQAINCPVLTTRQAAGILDISIAYASQILRRLSASGSLVSLKKGMWLIDKRLHGLQLGRYITAPFPSYVSLQSALYYHGMISQIPSVIYLVTIARTRRLKTPVADYSLHHVDPRFFFGFSLDPDTEVALATPEKALIDFLYLTPSRSRFFKALPELSLPDDFDREAASDIVVRIPSKRTRALVSSKLSQYI